MGFYANFFTLAPADVALLEEDAGSDVTPLDEPEGPLIEHGVYEEMYHLLAGGADEEPGEVVPPWSYLLHPGEGGKNWGRPVTAERVRALAEAMPADEEAVTARWMEHTNWSATDLEERQDELEPIVEATLSLADYLRSLAERDLAFTMNFG